MNEVTATPGAPQQGQHPADGSGDHGTEQHGRDRVRGWARDRPRLAVTLALGLAVAGGFVLASLAWFSRQAQLAEVIAAELAGSRGGIAAALGGQPAPPSELWWVHAGLVASGAAVLAGACLLGASVFSARAGSAARFAALLAALAALAHLGQAAMVTLAWQAAATDAVFAAGAALAATSYVLLAPGLLIAPVAVATTLVRAAGHRKQRRVNASAQLRAEDVVPPPPLDPWAEERGRNGISLGDLDRATRWRGAARVPPGREPAAVGFCVSGGGIRSACVTLGALQRLRAELRSARYLVSVSGGGYTAGAMLLALQNPPDADGRGESIATPADVFEPGSAEEDHLRRHGKYLADGAGEWLVALGVVLRGVLASLALLAGAVITAGLALSWAYRLVPVTDLEPLAAQFATGAAGAFGLRAPVVAAIAALLGAAAVVWLAWLLWMLRATPPAVVLRAFRALVLIALLLATVAVVIPAVVWAGALLLGASPIDTAAQAAGGGAAVGALAYIGVLAGVLWRHRQRFGGAAGRMRALFRGSSDQPPLVAAVPRGVLQQVVVWLVLAVLLAASLLLLGWTVAVGSHWPLAVQVAVPVVLAVLAFALDQTWLSLHPFYRQRLARAFAVRRIRYPNGEVVARPYGFTAERTPLDDYGTSVPLADVAADPQAGALRGLPRQGFPQVIFAASAHLSGRDRTPPGRRAVSFTLSHDYLGGPDVGYVRTGFLEHRLGLSRYLASDLTVQAAVSISAAAFASAMGRQALPLQTLLAVSNARLGSWLPNPAAVHELTRDEGDWRVPRLPAVRRLSYLLREVFGRYPSDAPLLYVTDGGHYDNLGLVELLRHRVRTVYCIDASADSPPLATALGDAIALAQEELGVRIDLDDPRALVPGSAPPLAPEDPLAALNARLSRSAVVRGEITYPALGDDVGGPGEPMTGRLIVVKSSLTRDMPYELLCHAHADAAFPRNSTSDQWFDHQQFHAYQALGRYLGEKVREAARAARAAPPAATATGEPTDGAGTAARTS